VHEYGIFIIGLILGGFLGTVATLLISALCATAARGDERRLGVSNSDVVADLQCGHIYVALERDLVTGEHRVLLDRGGLVTLGEWTGPGPAWEAFDLAVREAEAADLARRAAPCS